MCFSFSYLPKEKEILCFFFLWTNDPPNPTVYNSVDPTHALKSLTITPSLLWFHFKSSHHPPPPPCTAHLRWHFYFLFQLLHFLFQKLVTKDLEFVADAYYNRLLPWALLHHLLLLLHMKPHHQRRCPRIKHRLSTLLNLM